MDLNNLDDRVLDLTKLGAGLSKRINEIASQNRFSFIEFITRLGTEWESDIDWWVSSIASRNIYASNLFLDYCYMVLVNDLICEGHEIDKILVDSKHLKAALESAEFLDKKIKVVAHNLTVSARIKNYLKSSMLLNWFNTLKLLVTPLLYAKMTRRFSKPGQKENLILIDAFLMKGKLYNEKGLDHFYPNLFTYCSPAEKDQIYFLPTYYQMKNYRSIFLKIRKEAFNYLLKEDYLHFSDYVYAFMYFFRVRKKFQFKDTCLNGFAFGKLVNDEIKLNSVSYASIEALLKYRLARRLKELGFQFSLVINWFENQAIDHGFNAGFRKYFPDTPIWGYQSFPLPDNYLCAFPTEQEMRCAVIPNRVLVMGKAFVSKARRFCPELDVEASPPLRYWWIWEERRFFPDESFFTIMVALPYMVDDAILLIKMITEVFDLNPGGKFRFWIKPHPTHSSKNILQYSKNWPEQLELIEGDTNIFLEKSNLVVTTSSGICLETISRGIPLVCVCLNGIILDYIPEDIKKDIWTLCFTKEDLIKAIAAYANRSDEALKDHEDIGLGIRNDYYEPVNRRGVRNLLNLGGLE